MITFVHFCKLQVSEPQPTEHPQITWVSEPQPTDLPQITWYIPNLYSPPNTNLLTIMRRLGSEHCDILIPYNSPWAKTPQAKDWRSFMTETCHGICKKGIIHHNSFATLNFIEKQKQNKTSNNIPPEPTPCPFCWYGNGLSPDHRSWLRPWNVPYRHLIEQPVNCERNFGIPICM